MGANAGKGDRIARGFPVSLCARARSKNPSPRNSPDVCGQLPGRLHRHCKYCSRVARKTCGTTKSGSRRVELMNLLAHTLLSPPSPPILVGNLTADWVKGRARLALPAAL